MNHRLRLLTFALAATLLLTAAARAAETLVDGATLKGGKPLALKGGEMEVILRPLLFPENLTVLPNGSFKVGEGKERPLKEGQMLSRDGRLMSPDGKLEFVFNHVTMDHGQLTLVKDGERSVISSEFKFENGARVNAEGWITSANNGRRSRLLDGQMLLLSGAGISAQDTVTLKAGKMVVQKDGAQLEVARGRTMMMADGTKVSGDGYVVFKGGKRQQLAEGEIVTLEGAVQKR
ncbi:MAG: hypothetical protein HY301_13010 [Verrucomicrobia bacterium]|nr:hypothetical protein [Verrucomicrobiota bacterium]